MLEAQNTLVSILNPTVLTWLGAARNALTGDRDLKMLRPARFEGKSTTPVTMDPSLSQRDASFLPQGALRILSRTISTIATIVAGILKKYDI